MGRPKIKSNRIERQCEKCNKEFWIYKSKAEKGYKKCFCSIECYNASKVGNGNPNWKNKTTSRICPICKNTFMSTRGKYCSKECKWKSLKKELTIDNVINILKELELNNNITLPNYAKKIGTTEKILKRMLCEKMPDRYETVMERRRITRDKWYKRGRDFERKVQANLKSIGYITMLSPRSMGAADIIAMNHGKTIFIQCKLYGAITKKERTSLGNMANMGGGIPIVATEHEGEIKYFIPNGDKGKKRIMFNPERI